MSRLTVHAFPTAVGMNRNRLKRGMPSTGVPHSRGDEPSMADLQFYAGMRSPQPWG